MGSSLRIGLRGRAIAYCVAVILITGSLLGAAMLLHRYQDSVEAVTGRCVTSARNTAYMAEAGLQLLNREWLNHMAGVASGEEDVLLAGILDGKGHMPSTLKEKIPKGRDEVTSAAQDIDRALATRVNRDPKQAVAGLRAAGAPLARAEKKE